MDTSIEFAGTANYYADKEVLKLDMTKEKLDIGRRVYEHEIDRKEAADRLGVTEQTIHLYVREYLKSIGIEVARAKKGYDFCPFSAVFAL